MMATEHSCSRCGNDGFLASVDQRTWLCRDCFFATKGKAWPWPQVVPFDANPAMQEWLDREGTEA